MVGQIAVDPTEGDRFAEAAYRKRSKSITRALSVKRIKSIARVRPVAPMRRVKRIKLRFRDANSVPGWFDRWHFFRKPTESRASISRISDVTGNMNGYRKIILGIALHVCVITGLVGLLLFVEPVAHRLQEALQSSNSAGYGIRLGLAAAAMLELVVFKLVFTVPALRVLVFALYTATLATLIASVLTLMYIPSAMLTLGILAGSWCLRVCLSMLPVPQDAFTICVVLPPGLIVFCTLAVLMETTSDDWSFSLGMGGVWEIVSSFMYVFEINRLGETLSMQEAHWGVYFFSIDLLVVGVLQLPLYSGYGLWWLFEWTVLLPLMLTVLVYKICRGIDIDDDGEEEVEYYE